MKNKKLKTLLVILAFTVAVILGVMDGIKSIEETEVGIHVAETAPDTDSGEFLEVGSDVLKDAFENHIKFRYPELFIWKAVLDSNIQGK